MRRLLRDQSGRNDALDGLRAFAVAAVMAFHFGLPGATAGFLGVDVFFVLSGYLITRILLSQIQAGRLDLAGFWVRRIRRLAPALVVSVMAVIAWGALVAPAIVRDGLRSHITSTLAYVANWHFIESGSYFAAMGDEDPRAHVVARGRRTVLPRLADRPVRTDASGPAPSCEALRGRRTGAHRDPHLGVEVGIDLERGGPTAPTWGRIRGSSGRLSGLARRRPDAPCSDRERARNERGPPRDRRGARGVGHGVARLLHRRHERVRGWRRVDRGPRIGGRHLGAGDARVPATRFLGLLPVAYLGRLSYGIYIWHWPLILWSRENQWLDMSEWPTILRVPVLAALTVALASLSYHLVEKPIRYGKLATHLSRRRTVIALPVALGLLVALNTMLVVPQAGAAEGDTTRTIMLVGDSVPQQLATEFSRAAASKGYVAILATRGGCPATGVMVVDTRGRPAGEGDACPRLVPQRQDDVTRRFRPALVIWWSRYEIADRLASDGTRLTVGTAAYWRAQRKSFAERIAALTRFGADVVTVQIERSGRGMLTRCSAPKCGPLLHRLIYDTDLQDTWNAFLAGNHGPSVHSISINRFVCHDAASPCDDRLADGSLARSDGTHYSDEAGAAVARRIVTEALDAAGLRSHAK